MGKAPELKPCPFCGANAFLYRPDDVGCSSPDCWMSYKGRHVKPEEWNTRADLAPMTPAQAVDVLLPLVTDDVADELRAIAEGGA